MATTEHIGLLTAKDESGNKQLLYPITKVEAVDGLEEELANITPENIGAVPNTRTVNGKALSEDISLGASDVGAAAATHEHSADEITSGILPVTRGGIGVATLTSGRALIGAGTGAVTTRAITNNTSASKAITGSTNLVTMNTLQYALNRTVGPTSADTSYGTWMMRPIRMGETDLTAGSSGVVSGSIQLVYE